MKPAFLLTALSIVIAGGVVLSPRANAEQASEDMQQAEYAQPQKLSTKEKRRLAKAEKANDGVAYPALPDASDYIPANGKTLKGATTYVEVGPRFGVAVHSLTKTALNNNPEYLKTAKAVDHYRTKTQRTIRFTKDAVNYVYPYRGFSMSMEGSRLLLDKNQKLNNLCIAEMAKQRYWDEMHPKVMAKIMQIAMGLGLQDPAQSEAAVQKGVTGLEELVGKDDAQSTLAQLAEWKNQLAIPEAAFQQPPWDVDTSQRVYQNALKVSAEGDPLIHSVFSSVKKYDHGKLANFTASVVEANLSAVTVLSGSPMISLAAEGANTAFVMATGGPEENKILKELYYGRRLEIRRKRISDEAQLALANYEKALLTHNAPQLAMSEIVLGELVGSEKIATVLEHEPGDELTLNAPIELGKKDVL